ncbi:MAG TPA: TraB/GumN family protein [Burkholderiaceae bacterium]|nr:TraB/GumN family protein [Burkholderiaceae bacterium]
MFKFMRARRLWVAGCIASLLFGAVQAQPDNSRRGFLYEIRKGNQTALLMGTIHVGRPEFYPLPAATLARIEGAERIVLEADVSDSARAIAATQKYAVYANGDPGLDTRLSPALKARIETIAARNGLEMAPLWRMKPWMLGNVLTLFEAAQAGYMPALSVEAYLIRTARQGGKPILELEGIEQQFELFERAPFATQVAFLEDTVKAVETNSARREINRISQAWETGDQAALDRLLAEMRAQTSLGARFTVDTILLGRHPAMLKRIEALMGEGRGTLIAVGSLHLAGPEGLVAMLRARGYTVTAL